MSEPLNALSDLDRARIERQDAVMARIAAQEQSLALQAGVLADEKKREQEAQAALRKDILARYEIGPRDRILPDGTIARAPRPVEAVP